MTSPTIPTDPQDLFNALWQRREQLALSVFNSTMWFNNSQQVQQVIAQLPPQAMSLATPLAWSRMITESVADGVRLLGYRDPVTLENVAPKLDWWKSNRMKVQARAVHTATLADGLGFITVTSDPVTNEPIIRAESMRALTTLCDPATGAIVAALRVYGGTLNVRWSNATNATLYTADQVISYAKIGGAWEPTGDVEHTAGRCPVVQFANVADLDSPPWPEAKPAWPIIGGATRGLVSMQLTGETMGAPLRVLSGVTPQDLTSASGQLRSEYEVYTSALLALGDPTAKLMQVAAAEMSNFQTLISVYASLVASVTPMPLTRLWPSGRLQGDSFDAVSVTELPLVERRQAKIDLFMDPWSEVPPLVAAVTGNPDDAPDTEPVFQSPELATLTGIANAGVLLKDAGVVSVQWIQERMGMTPTEMALEATRLANSPVDQLLSGLGLSGQPTGTAPAPGGPPAANPPAPGQYVSI
jgi:hypothetical protein